MLKKILQCIAVGCIVLLASCDSNSTGDDLGGGGTITSIPWSSSIAYGALTDSRDGKTYKTVTIGTQTWMAENLNIQTDSSWCYGNSVDSCTKYGRLYQWSAAMGLNANYNSVVWGGSLPRQGVCPSGWHVPSDDEWDVLAVFVGGTTTAGVSLKSTSGWANGSSYGNGTDAYGFRALPAGNRSYELSFYNAGSDAYFWSSSEIDADVVWRSELYSRYDDMYPSRGGKKAGFSVRCLKDAP